MSEGKYYHCLCEATQTSNGSNIPGSQKEEAKKISAAYSIWY